VFIPGQGLDDDKSIHKTPKRSKRRHDDHKRKLAIRGIADDDDDDEDEAARKQRAWSFHEEEKKQV